MRSCKTILLSLILTATVVSFGSCTKEDEDDCLSDLSLRFKFTKDGSDLFGPDIASLSLFVFDSEGYFVARFDEYDNRLFGSDYVMHLPLSPGTYSFTVWGGLKDDDYDICDMQAGTTKMSEATLHLSRPGDNYRATDLYYGGKTNVSLLGSGNQEVEIDLMKHSKQVNVQVKGLKYPRTRASLLFPQYSFLYEACNGGCDFLGEHLDPVVEVSRGIEAEDADSETLSMTIHTYRMMHGREYMFSIYDHENDRTLFSENLLEKYIARNPSYATQKDIDGEDTFNITLDFSANVGVTVTVNGWKIDSSGSVIQ